MNINREKLNKTGNSMMIVGGVLMLIPFAMMLLSPLYHILTAGVTRAYESLKNRQK